MPGFIGENRLPELLTLIKNKFVQNDQKATASTIGLVKPDGTSITVDANGAISATAPTISSIDDISDVSITSPSDDQALVYDQTNSEWINKTITTPIATASTVGTVKPDGTSITVDGSGTISATTPVISSIDDISDVNITTPTDGQILAYDQANSEWVNEDAPSSIPDGGTTGQVLSKHSNTDKDVEWAPIPNKAISQSDFDALSQSEKDNGTAYYIYDSDGVVSKTVMGYTPIGTVISVMGNHAPLHYLICDGTTYNITDYPELADYFEDEFGTKNHFGGDGTTTFAVPDLQGEFLRGAGTNSHTNQGSGANVGVHQDATEIPFINTVDGYINVHTNPTTQSNDVVNADFNIGTVKRYTWVQGTRAGESSASYSYTSRPTNTSVLYCIATKNIYTNPENIYSTNESVVGRWIDGKPLYQKTIDCGTGPKNTYKRVAHNISNIEFVTDVKGIGTAVHDYSYPIPVPSHYNLNYSLQVSVDSTNITLDTGNGADYSGQQCYITIQYTKTTD